MLRTTAFLTTLTIAFSTSTSQACCLTDWLFGRTHTPYAVGYAPVAVSQPYVASYAPVASTTVATPTVTSARVSLSPATVVDPLANSGVYQAQRPAYLNNPSVYTGLPPQANVQTTYRAPVVSAATTTAPVTTYRTPVTSGAIPAATFYRAPSVGSLQFNRSYTANYAAAQAAVTPNSLPGGPIQVPTPTGTPATAIPATPVAPLYPATTPVGGGLRRFFSSLFGTGYRSSYYRAPITYYRPATSVDPVTGTTVTVQQPCSSYVQQLQRTPFTTLQPSAVTAPPVQTVPPSGSAPSGACTTVQPQANTIAPSAYSQGTVSPYGATPGYSGTGAVGQTGGTAGGSTVPIPSTVPGTSPGGYDVTPGFGSPAPLQGSPSTGGTSREDLTPLEQPRLESARPPSLESDSRSDERRSAPVPETSAPSSAPPPRSYWQLQNADDSTAMIRPSTRTNSSNTNEITMRRVEPIRAPSDYTSPFHSRRSSTVGQSARTTERQPAASSPTQRQPMTRSRELPTTERALPNTNSDSFEAPPLPTRSVTDPRDLTSVSTRRSIPAREAALIRSPQVSQKTVGRSTPNSGQREQKIERDSTWFVTPR